MIETTENKLVYAVSSTNIYTFNLPFFEPSDIHCYSYKDGEETELVRGTDFSVETKSDYSNGADITITKTLPAGSKLAIVRIVDAVQRVHLPEYGKLPSAPVEKELDRLVMLCQQVLEACGRGFLKPYGMDGYDTARFFESVQAVAEHGEEWAERAEGALGYIEKVYYPGKYGGLEGAVEAANEAKGGVVYVPEGLWELRRPLKLTTGVRLVGAGRNKTYIVKIESGGMDFAGRTTEANWALSGDVETDGAGVVDTDAVIILSGDDSDTTTEAGVTAARNCAYCGISDLTVGGRAQYGILGARYVKFCTIERVLVTTENIPGYAGLSGACGVVLPCVWSSRIEQVRVHGYDRGFAIGMATSLVYQCNYVSNALKVGHSIYNALYSKFASCACDHLNYVTSPLADTDFASVCYRFHACYGCDIGTLGAEGCNATFISLIDCHSCTVHDSLSLSGVSSYNGSRNPASLLYLKAGDLTIDCVIRNIRADSLSAPVHNASRHSDIYIADYATKASKFAGLSISNTSAATSWGNNTITPGKGFETPWSAVTGKPDLWGPVEDVSESRTFVGRGVSEFSVTKGPMDYHMQQKYGTSYMRIWGCFDATVTYTDDEDVTTTTYVLPSGFVTADAVLPAQKIKIATNLLSLECFKLNPENSNGLMFKADGTIYTPESGTHITFVYDGYYKINA